MGARKTVYLLQVRFSLLAPRDRFVVRLWMEPQKIAGYKLYMNQNGYEIAHS